VRFEQPHCCRWIRRIPCAFHHDLRRTESPPLFERQGCRDPVGRQAGELAETAPSIQQFLQSSRMSNGFAVGSIPRAGRWPPRGDRRRRRINQFQPVSTFRLCHAANSSDKKQTIKRCFVVSPIVAVSILQKSMRCDCTSITPLRHVHHPGSGQARVELNIRCRLYES